MSAVLTRRFAGKPLPGAAVIDWSHPLARRLEAFYLLNDRSNLVVDLARGRHGSPTGATRANQNGVGTRGQRMSGGAWDFSSTTHRLDCGTFGFSMAEGATVEAWVFPDTLSGTVDARYVSKADGTLEANHDWMIGATSSGGSRFFRARMGRMAATALGTTNYSGRTGTWINLCGRLMIAGGGADLTQIYVDGGLEAQSGFATASTGATANAVYIGNQPTDAVSAPDGRIGLVAVWSRTLTAEEILWRNREPFDLLRPSTRRTYVDFVAAGGGGGGATGHYYRRLLRAAASA